MYINPFVAGVIATIMVELILVLGFALFTGNKKQTQLILGGKLQWQESL